MVDEGEDGDVTQIHRNSSQFFEFIHQINIHQINKCDVKRMDRN